MRRTHQAERLLIATIRRIGVYRTLLEPLFLEPLFHLAVHAHDSVDLSVALVGNLAGELFVRERDDPRREMGCIDRAGLADTDGGYRYAARHLPPAARR